MKVFVVTSGYHDDYHIERVFLEEEKAERYAELKNTCKRDEYRVEEFDTDDDKVINEIPYIRLYKIKDSSWEKDSLKINICKGNTLDDTEKSLNKQYLWLTKSEEKQMMTERVLPFDYIESDVINKYTKAVNEIMSKVDSLLTSDEWSQERVTEWFEKEDSINDIINNSL